MSCTTMVYSSPRVTMYSSPCNAMYYLPPCLLMDVMSLTLALLAQRHRRPAPPRRRVVHHLVVSIGPSPPPSTLTIMSP